MSDRTPGPWGLRGYQIRSDRGHGQHVATYQISEADGRLLAAAPQLLEALIEVTGVLIDHLGEAGAGRVQRAINAAREAIEEAGE